MRVSDDDRITRNTQRRSPLTTVAILLLVVAGISGIAYRYINNADDNQRQQLAALQQAVRDVAQPVSTTPPPVTVEQPAAITEAPPTDPVATSEPPLAPAPELPALPPLDESDAAVRQELAGLAGWQADTSALLVPDQLLRRFVTFINNVAAGKLDHKSGPFLPIKGRFAVTAGASPTMTADSLSRYNLYVELLTALDPGACAALYRRYYPLLNAAYGELGEKDNFHALVLKAIQQLEKTPDLGTTPALVAADKGLYKYADPKLEALPPVQKQMLRSGWENVSKIKVWLRQLKAALLVTPT